MQKDDEVFLPFKTWLFRHQVLLSWGEEVAEWVFSSPMARNVWRGKDKDPSYMENVIVKYLETWSDNMIRLPN